MPSYDVIVVGGGVVGMSTAYHLVCGGARSLLIDRADLGRASDAGAGILSTASATDHANPVYRFVAHAARYYPQLIARLRADGAGDTGYATCGSLTVAVGDDEVAELDLVRASLRRGRGADPEGQVEIAAERARELFPPLASVRGAIHSPRGARVDGRLLSVALQHAAADRGLERRRDDVRSLVLKNGAVGGVALTGERIAAGHVVIAAGAWSPDLLAPLGVPVPVEPQRGQIIHLDVPETGTGEWPIVLAFRGHYLVPWEDQRVVAGATRETGSGFRPHTTVTGVMEVLREATRVAPGLRRAAVREIRVGLRPASADGLPILGAVPGWPNLLLATGHGSIGLQLGPYSGRVIAQAIVAGEAEVDIAPFSVARFA